MTENRTNDPELRNARRAKLMAALEAATKAAEGKPFEILASGSLSRGQIHPWSDLDLLIRSIETEDPNEDNDRPHAGLRHQIMGAIEDSGLWDYDIITEESLFEALKPAMSGSAKKLADVPPLSDLPDPDLAFTRGAQSFHFALERVAQMMADGAALAENESFDEADRRLMESSTQRMVKDVLSYKAKLALKRLAVFQDGGRSAYLDNPTDDNALELIERLSKPVDGDEARPAVVPADAVDWLPWLLDDGFDARDSISAERIDQVIEGVKTWMALLKSATTLEDTSGFLPPPEKPPAP